MKKGPTNWVAVELAYTTSARTLEDMGAEFGVTAGRISQKAKEMRWKRGALMDRVRAQADAKVQAQEAHDASVQAGTEAAVDHSAVLMANTILRERRDVGRLVVLAGTLMTELENHGKKPVGRPAKGAPPPDPVAVRIDNLRKLTATVKDLTALERSVLGISPDTPIDPTKRVEEAIESGMAGLRAKFHQVLGKGA